MTRTHYRCGAPVKTRDPRKRFDYCRVLVATEGARCYHHREVRKEPLDGR